jgi:hypothetical protein
MAPHSRHGARGKGPQSANWLWAFALIEWAWVELNYRPHAYQAGSYERELGLEILPSLPFTNILLSTSRIYEHIACIYEQFAHLNGHHYGHHS